MPEGVRVIKLGGSMLGEPLLADLFGDWLSEQPPLANVLVVGGGAVVDKLRERDRTEGLEPSDAHWLAIRAMSDTAAVVAELLGQVPLVQSLDRLQLRAPGLEILDVERFLQDDARGDDPLPESWDVTSDSIAARLTSRLGTNELVLLKAAPAPTESDLESLSAAGYVDAYFPRAAVGLRVRFVCLAQEKGGRMEASA
jgi:aspartokinase-like uncharacterized kinase